MRRRGALLAVGLPALGGVHEVLAQYGSVPVVGFLSGVSRAESADRVAAFRRGLAEAGHAEGRRLSIAFRWADGDYGRLPALAAELVRLPVTVLLATGGPRAVLAAKAVTSALPIVFTLGGDPVQLGIVQSLSRPGGNATGVSFLTLDLTPKRLELLREMLPKARMVVLLINPGTPSSALQVKTTQEAARAMGLQLHVAPASSESGIEAAFAGFARLRPDALLVGSDAFFAARRKQLVGLSLHHGLPTMYEGRESVVAGGLISYGPSIDDAHARAGVYVGRILDGALPAELPVLQPTQFELVVNLKTARAQGIAMPQKLLLRADEVIQ